MVKFLYKRARGTAQQAEYHNLMDYNNGRGGLERGINPFTHNDIHISNFE